VERPVRAQVPASWGRGYDFPKYRLLGLGKSEGRTINTPAI